MKKRMKKFIRILICLLVVCAPFGSCTKIWEDSWIERIPRPVVEIDTIMVPPWDETDSLILNNKKTSKYETDKENLRNNSVAGGDNAAGLSL